MKKYILILIINGFYFLLNAQFIHNKLNIGLGSALCIPINRQTIDKDNFSYPSLYGNYKSGFCGQLSVDYNYSSELSIGIEFTRSVFNNWEGDQNAFVLQNPSLHLSTFSLNTYYIPKHLQTNSGIIKWGILFAPEIAFQKVLWSEINQNTEDEIFPYDESSILPGFKTGIGVILFNSNILEIRSDINYEYLHVKSYYYLDNAFHSINISLKFYLKLIKNRNYRYE